MRLEFDDGPPLTITVPPPSQAQRRKAERLAARLEPIIDEYSAEVAHLALRHIAQIIIAKDGVDGRIGEIVLHFLPPKKLPSFESRAEAVAELRRMVEEMERRNNRQPAEVIPFPSRDDKNGRA